MSPVDYVRRPMPKQEPFERVRNFDEVALGYTPELAREEAGRCLGCKKPGCVEGCPVGIDIPGFIGLVADGEFAAAARKVKETNALPAVCGRVCPQEEQCERNCLLSKKGDPVAIGRLERFVADYEAEDGAGEAPPLPPLNGLRIAIVGSGPAGITVAADLALKGYEVTMFEALHEAGGVLTYGIPEFRLPKAIVRREVDVRAQPGCRPAPRLRGRQDDARSTRWWSRSTPCSSAPAPACRGSWTSPART